MNAGPDSDFSDLASLNRCELPPTHCALPPTQRGRERHKKILAAAEQVFLEQGFEAASMSEIVRRSGGSLATLYKLFGTKEVLFESLTTARAQALYESLSVDRFSSLPPEQVLFNIGMSVVGICASSPGVAILRIVMAENQRFPRLGEIFLHHAVDLVQRDLGAYLQQQIKANVLELDNPQLAAMQFLEMAKGDLPLRIGCGSAVPPRKELERNVAAAVKLFLRGAIPRSSVSADNDA